MSTQVIMGSSTCTFIVWYSHDISETILIRENNSPINCLARSFFSYYDYIKDILTHTMRFCQGRTLHSGSAFLTAWIHRI